MVAAAVVVVVVVAAVVAVLPLPPTRLLDAAALPEGAPRTVERPAHGLAYYTHYAMGVQPVFDAFRAATGEG